METVHEYAELYARGLEKAGIVYFDGQDYWLADGFHREAASRLAGKKHMLVEVLPGTRRDARLRAAASNIWHGLKRSLADKRKSVHLVLADPEAGKWDDKAIAEHCQVSLALVQALRVSTPWTQPQGLYGPDDLAKPPAPDRALEDEDKTRERAWRAARKYLRFCALLEMDPLCFLDEVKTEMGVVKPKKRKAPADEEGECLATISRNE